MAIELVQDLSFPVKVYVVLLHLLLLFLVVLFLQRPSKKSIGDKDEKHSRKIRTLTKDNRAVTIEPCAWLNSTLAWFYLHAQGKDRTPNIVRLWIRALNKQLQKDKKKDQRIIIESLCPGCLPPKLTSVYCLSVSGNMQCITFHVESVDLGFLVRVIQQTSKGPKTTSMEVRVVRLAGEVALKLSTSPSRIQISAQFIGVPEIALSTKCLGKESQVDASEVQEKVKEVICKTITSIPLSEATSKEQLSDASSANSKEQLDSPSSPSCIGEEGKLLVKIIKASGLCGKIKSGSLSPYCILSTSNPLQRKRTTMVRDNENPFWNEYFTFDVNPKTKEITLDIYDYEKTEKDSLCHLEDNEFTEEQDPERPSAHSSPSEEAAPVFMNGEGPGAEINGHIPVRKRYIESSLDELAMEIEAYEASDEKPKKADYENGVNTDEQNDEPELIKETPSPIVVMATPVIEPVVEKVVKEPVEEPVKLIEEAEVPEVEVAKEENKEAEEEEKGQEEELKEQEIQEQNGKEDEGEKPKEQEEVIEKKSKTRRSFKFSFKRKQSDKKTVKEEEKVAVVEEKAAAAEEKDAAAEEKDAATEEKAAAAEEKAAAVEELEEEIKESNDEVMKEESVKDEEMREEGEKEEQLQQAESKEEGLKDEDKKDDETQEQEEKETEIEKSKELEEMTEQASELNTKPKLRRSFNLFRRRPVSMSAADRDTDKDEEKVFKRDDPIRHSYHAGDLPVPDPSNLRKSTSQSSLLSYSPNPHSTLVIETVHKGQKKYAHIPPVMAKRQAYEKGGNKLHIYNDHIFTAVHFTGSPPECAVCTKPIKGKIGKQGYQCRECKLVTHRDCHYQTTTMCSSDAVKHLDIKKMPQFVGH
ncbi:C2 domain-containing protein 2-like [Stylophora pistillata]|uniref:C2 domain-containing protein 2-like n=1 Tax=Stylophora pistillata TaxID=50429 RepID=UPI000C03A7FF|nr:C2 domain-containing protein 2-like [Stylophora pistillata]